MLMSDKDYSMYSPIAIPYDDYCQLWFNGHRIGKLYNIDNVSKNFLNHYIYHELACYCYDGSAKEDDLDEDMEAMFEEWVEDGCWSEERDCFIDYR